MPPCCGGLDGSRIAYVGTLAARALLKAEEWKVRFSRCEAISSQKVMRERRAVRQCAEALIEAEWCPGRLQMRQRVDWE